MRRVGRPAVGDERRKLNARPDPVPLSGGLKQPLNLRHHEAMKTTLLLGIVGIFFITFTLNGCSTATPMVSEWRNPALASGSFQRLMIRGPSGETTLRRNFEDEFVAQLTAAGIDALASYRYVPEIEGIDENKLKQAAQTARADGLLVVRSLKVEEKTNYPAIGPEISFGIFGSNVGAGWSGFPGASGSSRYNEYTSETVLYDVAGNDLVWTGTVKTTDPANVQTAIKSYVQTVIKALTAQNLFPKR